MPLVEGALVLWLGEAGGRRPSAYPSCLTPLPAHCLLHLHLLPAFTAAFSASLLPAAGLFLELLAFLYQALRLLCEKDRLGSWVSSRGRRAAEAGRSQRCGSRRRRCAGEQASHTGTGGLSPIHAHSRLFRLHTADCPHPPSRLERGITPPQLTPAGRMLARMPHLQRAYHSVGLGWNVRTEGWGSWSCLRWAGGFGTIF